MNVPSSDPLAYPFGIPGTSFALTDGVCELGDDRCFRGKDLSFSKIAAAFSWFDPHEPIRDAVGVLACGSNASPTRLAEKLRGSPRRTAFGVRIALSGWIPVYAATLSYYGAIPATFEFVTRAEAEPFLIVLDESSLAPIIKSELRSDNYETYCVPAQSIGRSTDFPIYAFVAAQGALRLDGEVVPVPGFESGCDAPFGPSQKDVLTSVLDRLPTGRAFSEFVKRLSDTEFVLDIRAEIIEVFGSSPFVPGWGKVPPHELTDLLSASG